MRCLQLFTNMIENKLTNAGQIFTPRKFKIEPCKSIVLKVAEEKNINNLKRLYTDTWCLDDVGTEDNYRLFVQQLHRDRVGGVWRTGGGIVIKPAAIHDAPMPPSPMV